MSIFFARHRDINEFKKVRYDNFDSNEYYPITETGKYLRKKYGQFDVIYSSPRHRCIQTAESIKEEIKYNGKIIESDLLLEANAGKLNLMNESEIIQFLSENEDLTYLKEKINTEQNEFKKINLNREYMKKSNIYTEQTEQSVIENNYRKFLNSLTKLQHKRILVVCHSGTISLMTKIICNISFSSNVGIYPREYSVLSKEHKEMYFNGNCTIMALLFENNIFNLVIAPNNLHLEHMHNKIQQNTSVSNMPKRLHRYKYKKYKSKYLNLKNINED